MKKLLLLVPIILLAAGCSPKTLTVDEVIEQTQKCEKAGLIASSVHTYSDLRGDAGIVRIDCEPKK